MPEPREAEAEERRRFIADLQALASLGLSLDELADPDLRSAVIRREHPDLERALREGRSEVDVGGEPVNARLHLLMHEIVATQLVDDDPPEVWQTVCRLLDAGYDREEILHMIAAPLADQIWATLNEERPYDRQRHLAALAALPGSWERQRADGPAPSR
ncbi:MAG TPA: DUF1841 family protein [Solirubrobacterales bacterium]|nr:DUF1841 family protein [Solirubrobacterales bacterium]